MDPPYGGLGGPVARKKTEAQLREGPRRMTSPREEPPWSLGVDVKIYFVPP